MTKKNGTTTQYLVILGVGSDLKAHAARFNEADETVASKAAELMWLRLGRAKGDTALKLARKLPQGRIFASGKALVPLVKTEIYDELLKVLSFDASEPERKEATQVPANDVGDAQPLGTVPQADLWTALGIGSVVLAFEEDKDGSGWWEAVVIAVSKDGGTLSLRWRDWPEARKFSRARQKVGILPLGA
jgi:hypothetical protein